MSVSDKLSHDLTVFFPEFLRVRSHDPEEAIRHDVIVSIVTAAKKDLSLVNDALLNFVKERTLDKRVSGKYISMSCQCVTWRDGFLSLSFWLCSYKVDLCGGLSR